MTITIAELSLLAAERYRKEAEAKPSVPPDPFKRKRTGPGRARARALTSSGNAARRQTSLGGRHS